LHQGGSLGAVSYYDSLRVNLGLFQPDLNVLWDLGPHDFSIMDYLLDEDPLHVEATGYCHVNPLLPDIAYVTVHFASNTIAHFNLRACECFAHFCETKGLQQVLVVLLGSGGDWCEGEPVCVGQ
jgi:predicted dehydrogenase